MKAFFLRLWLEISNHNRYKIVAVIFCVGFLIYANGCQVTCDSILHPGTKITFAQLQGEVDEFSARAVSEANNIAREEQIRAYLWQTGLQTISAGSFNWLSFLTGAGSIVGIGAITDNVRYRLKFPQNKAT